MLLLLIYRRGGSFLIRRKFQLGYDAGNIFVGDKMLVWIFERVFPAARI